MMHDAVSYTDERELESTIESLQAEIEQKRDDLRAGRRPIGVVEHIQELQTERDELREELLSVRSVDGEDTHNE